MNFWTWELTKQGWRHRGGPYREDVALQTLRRASGNPETHIVLPEGIHPDRLHEVPPDKPPTVAVGLQPIGEPPPLPPTWSLWHRCGPDNPWVLGGSGFQSFAAALAGPVRTGPPGEYQVLPPSRIASGGRCHFRKAG